MKKRLISLILINIFILSAFTQIYAASVSEVKKKKATVDSKIRSVQRQKEIIKSNIIDAKTEKKSVLKAKEQVEQEKRRKERELTLLQREIQSINRTIQEAEKEYLVKNELLKKRLKIMYQNSKKSILEVLIESRDIADFFNKMHIISLLAKKDKQLIQEVSSAKKDLEYKKGVKQEEKIRKLKQTERIKSNIVALSKKVSRAEDEISQYREELDELKKKEDELISESKKLSSDIYRLQKQGTKYVDGKMKWPLSGYSNISSYFGNRYHPILHKRKLHTGIDITAPRGISIRASNKGTVILSGWRNGYGNTVVIDHGGGIATLYGHCSRLLVSEGEAVDSGQIIAKVGSTGYSTGPHLHFEVLKNGDPLNPLQYFGT